MKKQYVEPEFELYEVELFGVACDDVINHSLIETGGEPGYTFPIVDVDEPFDDDNTDNGLW